LEWAIKFTYQIIDVVIFENARSSFEEETAGCEEATVEIGRCTDTIAHTQQHASI